MSPACSASISATTSARGAAGTRGATRPPTQIIATVDRHAPGFAASVLGRQIHSPLDLERRFGLIGGDIFHGKMGLDQLFSARPMLGHADYRMPLKGLYLCGSGAHPGGGVTGAPGHNAARAVLADRGRGGARRVKPLAGIKRPRPQPGARRAVVHAIARRPRRRGDQDRAAGRRRRHAALGPAVARATATRGSPPISSPPTAARSRRRSISPGRKARRWSGELAARQRRRRREFQGRRPRQVRARRGLACAPPTRG